MQMHVGKGLLYLAILATINPVAVCAQTATATVPAPAGTDFSKLCPDAVYTPGPPGAPGTYVCSNFAADFNKNCAAQGIQSWELTLSFVNCSIPVCKQLPGHRMNVVAVCDPNSVFDKDCVVEPQNGQQWCWHQDGGSPQVPPWIKPLLYDTLGQAYSDCYNQCSQQGDLAAQATIF
jgi:hypothetical protein